MDCLIQPYFYSLYILSRKVTMKKYLCSLKRKEYMGDVNPNFTKEEGSK